MRIVKPLKLSGLTRVVEIGRRRTLHLTAWFGFSLATPRNLLDEITLWKAIGSELGTTLFDEGAVKAHGEVLMAGSCFTPGGQPLSVTYAGLELGAVSKRVAVIGDRHWHHGVPTEPAVFLEMPLDWHHAFGGPTYGLNPYGIGVDASRDDTSLPNVETLEGLIRSPSDRPYPAAFLPRDVTFSDRRKRAGTYDRAYAEAGCPGLPLDLDPTFFNVASPDQFTHGFWTGDEPFVIENMHPFERRIAGALPDLRVRAFVVGQASSTDDLREVRLRCDTVWFFPSQMLGAVLFHGTYPIESNDAVEIRDLLFACEARQSPRDVGEYAASLRRRLDKDQAALAQLSDSDLMPPRECGVAPNVVSTDVGAWTKGENIQLANSVRGEKRRRAQRREELAARGLISTGAELDDTISVPAPPPEDPDELVAYLVAMDEQMANEKAKLEGAASAEEDARARGGVDGVASGDDDTGGPPKIDVEERVEAFTRIAKIARSSGEPNVDLERSIQSGKLAAEIERMKSMNEDAYRAGAHVLPSARPMTAEAAHIARVLVGLAHETSEPLAERDLTGADLRGMDLRGMDFTRAFLEGADLRDCDLSGAILEGIVLAKADLRGANLAGARAKGANWGKANIEGAVFDGADLSGSVLTGARVAGARLVGAKLEGADMMDVDWSGVDLSGARFDKCIFLKAKLAGARFTGAVFESATFTECEMDGVDFTNANLHKVSFIGCSGSGVRFNGARFTEAVAVHGTALPEADLRDAIIEKSCLRTTVFRGARFDRAQMSMTDLSECDASSATFDRAVMKNALLIRTKLAHASLRGANLTEALLSSAEVHGADFTGAQLCRADFSGARGDGGTRFNEAAVDFTRFDRDRSKGGGAA